MTKIGGMVRTAPVIAALFIVAALSLAGVPPLSGFVSKFALIDAGISEHEYVIVAVSLVVSLLTLLSMLRIWAGVFWNPADAGDEAAPPMVPLDEQRRGGPRFMVWPTAALVLASLAIAVAAGPIYGISERAAQELLQPSSYVQAVLGR